MKDDFNKDHDDFLNKPLQDITEKDLLDRIELMKSVAPDVEQSLGTDKFRNAYFEQKKSFEASIHTRDANFIMGHQKGLHADKSLDNMYQQDNLKRSEIRRETYREVKIHYHQNYSVSKSFNEVGKDKPKEMDMDKG